MRNPVGDFIYYKVDNVWFIVVYVSKNNTEQAVTPAADEAAAPEEDQSESAEQPDAPVSEQLETGRLRILRTIRNLFLTQNKVVLMGDWNHLKDRIVLLMEELHATRLPTGPS